MMTFINQFDDCEPVLHLTLENDLQHCTTLYYCK